MENHTHVDTDLCHHAYSLTPDFIRVARHSDSSHVTRARKKSVCKGEAKKTWEVTGRNVCQSHLSGPIRFVTASFASLRLPVGVRDDGLAAKHRAV